MPVDDFRIASGKEFRLADFDPASKPCSSGDKEKDVCRLAELSEKLDQYQDIFYAERKRKVLVILQGMDTSGKDGTVRGVFRSFDPLGIRVVSFKAPTPDELAHDYLWRIHAQVPAKGEIAIFNRSHYEDVLVTRVHGWIDLEECERRYAQIRAFETLLVETGTTLVKCFLHISAAEQKARLQARLADPQKHWKFDPKDLEERRYWKAYMSAYEQAIRATATPEAPWHIVPADSKTHRNVMVAEIMNQAFSVLDPAYPPARPELSRLKVD